MLFRPVAFRIRNYKSINDSGVCTLSGDSITVLAGQNEAGKTSILHALYDFNGEPGNPPSRPDIVPDDNTSVIPAVAIEFSFNPKDVLEALKNREFLVSPPIENELTRGTCWIERDMQSGKFKVLGSLGEVFRNIAQIEEEFENQPKVEPEDIELAEEDVHQSGINLDQSRFCEFAYWEWPAFYYFDSFDDLLPRKIPIDTATKIVNGVPKVVEPKIPEAALNFLEIAEIDLEEVRRLATLEDDEKQLKNYLASRSTSVSGDFLGYWKTRTGTQTVKLRAEFSRRSDGAYLVFYVEDGAALQFPDQRSRGFLWFLSFYISLAAGVRPRKYPRRIVLIDDPGSFLHPKAQKDILDVLQRRIVQEGNLVVYSTHSPYLLPPEYLHRLRIVFKEGNGKTVVADRLTDPRIKGEVQGDALAPVMASIGMSVEANLAAIQKENFVVEGISDYYYLHGWAKLLNSNIFDKRGIVVSIGTPNIPYSVSQALTFSNNFAVLLDHDNAGKAAAEKLKTKMDISHKVIVQPQNALAIEDLFHSEDFAALVGKLDSKITIDSTQSPTTQIKKHSIDKVLLARTFAELVSHNQITLKSLNSESSRRASELLKALDEALTYDPVFRVK